MSTGLRRRYRQARDVIARPLVRGSRYECPLCGHTAGRFLAEGDPRRPARCAWCGSLERHRFLALQLSKLQPRRVLHVAPETAIASYLRRLSDRYVSIDLRSPLADIRADITQPLPLEGETFDAIVCSHVLEHIPDDAAAISQLSAALAPGGVLLVMVPVGAQGPTVEDVLSDPAERLRAYGNRDHVRLYGTDIIDRLAAPGLLVNEVSWRTTPDAERFGITNAAGDLYICKQP